MSSTELTASDWQDINEIVASIYSTRPTPNLKDVIERLRVLVGFSKSLTCLIGRRGNSVEFFEYQSSDISDEQLDSYRNHYIYHDFILWYCATPVELTFRESDVISEPYFSSSVFMREWLEPMGVHFGAGINIAGNGKSFANICLYRSLEEGDFTERDLLILRTVNAHLCICYRNLFPNGLDSVHFTSGGDLFASRYQLTSRETEVVKLIADGCTRKCLADSALVSENTMKKHLNSIFHKTETTNFSALVQLIEQTRRTVTKDEFEQGLTTQGHS